MSPRDMLVQAPRGDAGMAPTAVPIATKEVDSTTLRQFYLGKTPVQIVQEAGWTSEGGGDNLAPAGF